MDHPGIRQFMVLGFCIGGPFIWNLVKPVPDRLVAGIPAQPSGCRPEMPDMSYNKNMNGSGPELCARRPEITTTMVDAFLTNMYTGARADFVCSVTRDVVRNFQTPILGCLTTFQRIRTPWRWKPCILRPTRRSASIRGRHTGQDSAGGMPRSHLSSGISTRVCGAIDDGGRAVAQFHLSRPRLAAR
jgi:hypothetical protein